MIFNLSFTSKKKTIVYLVLFTAVIFSKVIHSASLESTNFLEKADSLVKNGNDVDLVIHISDSIKLIGPYDALDKELKQALSELNTVLFKKDILDRETFFILNYRTSLKGKLLVIGVPCTRCKTPSAWHA